MFCSLLIASKGYNTLIHERALVSNFMPPPFEMDYSHKRGGDLPFRGAEASGQLPRSCVCGKGAVCIFRPAPIDVRVVAFGILRRNVHLQITWQSVRFSKKLAAGADVGRL